MDKGKERMIQHTNRTTVFSATCQRIMDLFLSNPSIYFTPKTASMTTGLPYHTTKTCMGLLWRNELLTKEGGKGTNYYNITSDNMKFWAKVFRRYVYETVRK